MHNESGHYLPDVSLFNDICEILDIEVTELLKREKMKDNMNPKEVDETIMKIVDISDEKIKKNKKKITIISIIAISITIGFFGSILLTKNKQSSRYQKGDAVMFPSQMAIKEKEDGWVCHFDIEYMKDNLKIPYYYGYNCENFKYEELYDFMPTAQETNTSGIYEYKTTTNHPQYIFHSGYGKDIKAINEYFVNMEFQKNIQMDDLKDLELQYIKKEDVLELFNEAINSPKILKWGNIIKTKDISYMNTSMTKDNYTWKVGYILEFGHIKYIKLELMIKDEYLSDLIKNNKATEEQKELYKNMVEIENYIIEKQSFELPKKYENEKPYEFLKENLNDINRLEND